MLRRVISRERLDEGLFTSASDEGKACQIVCGIPCFCMCSSLIVLSVVAWLQTFHALSDQSRLVIEIPCSGEKAKDIADSSPNVLHHFEDCVFKKNASTMMIGSFVWFGQDMCGHTGRDMQTGALVSGMRVSFLGNSSNGVLKSWGRMSSGTGVPTEICDFKESTMSASLMIEKKHYEVNWVFAQRLVFTFVLLLWSSACAFFPDSDLTHCNDSFDAGQNARICILTLAAAMMSCFCGALLYGLGRVGWYVSIIVLAVCLAAGFSESLLEKSNSCCGRFSDANVDEEEPLIPQIHESTPDATTEDVQNDSTEDARRTDLYQVLFTVVVGASLGLLASILFVVGLYLLRNR